MTEAYYVFMHRIVTLLLILSTIVVDARQVSPDEAQSIADEFFNSASVSVNKAPRRAVRVTRSSLKKEIESQDYYIFNASDNAGFVIVSGDTRTRQILGYSDKGSFNAENMPPQLEWLLSEYRKALKKLAVDAKISDRQISQAPDQAPLLSTQWGQSAPYNDKCPMIDGSRALTGCVSTAMAQVINYEKKNNIVKAIPGYWPYYSDLPEYEFDFGNLDNDGIATLMLYCGCSVNMNYGIQESVAYVEDVPDALCNIFGWEREVRLMERAKYNEEHWNRMVREEISAGHPIIYSAVSDSGVGHCFVVDGTSSDDYFHVNWGWDGYLDGYFTFSPFGNDNKSDYVLMQCMVTTRDDDPSSDIITFGTTIDGINYQLNDNLTATVLPLKDGAKYSGELIIPSSVIYEGCAYTVSYFGQNAFVNCEHLTSISIPSTIVGQEWSIFDGCINLHKVNVEDMAAFIKLDVGAWPTGSPLNYGADLYLNGELVKDLVIPDGIEVVGYCKFNNCTSIESVTIPPSMKVAYIHSFSNCPKLKYIYYKGKSSLERIDGAAFANDEALEEIILPPSLKTIREFGIGQMNGPGCKKLRKIVSLATTPPWSEHNRTFSELHYSDAVVYVPDEALDAYRNAKEWCNFLEIRPLSEEKALPSTVNAPYRGLDYEINFTDKNAKIIAINGDYYKCDQVIPSFVEYDGQKYPVEIAGYKALDNAIGLYVRKFEAPLNKIGIASFRGVNLAFDVFEIPNKVSYIPHGAFQSVKINNLVIPETVISIGNESFFGNGEHIKSIESRNPQPPVISDDTFDSFTYEKTPLRVPFGCRKAYALAEGWRNFKNISNIGDQQEQVYDNDLTFTAHFQGNTTVRKRMPLTIVGSVFNSGVQKAVGFNLSWSIDDKVQGEKHFDVELKTNEVYTFENKIIVDVDFAGEHYLKLHISADGAVDQDISDNVVALSFESFDKNYYRVSLIEQFTSEACGLTPSSSPKIFSGIQNSGYSDFVAQVSHHCGYDDDFLTLNRDYEWFYNDYATYTPAMMLNRSDISGTGYTPVKGISDDVDREIIGEAGFCDAMVSVSCDIVDNKVIVKTLLEKNADFDLTSGYDYLTVFLIEDSIPSQAQVDVWTDGYLEGYIHRNSLRKVLSDTWGDRIEWDGDICAWKFESEIDASWDVDNLKAVAFIHRYEPQSPINCQVYTANSSALPQYGIEVDENAYKEPSYSPTLRIDQHPVIFDIYNILGIKVRSNASSFEGLPAGIYICNGKKVYVK